MPSETDVSAQERHELPDAVVRAQLERILASEVFSRSSSCGASSRSSSNKRLAGQGHSLKETVLAHELYGKRTDFEGGNDPVVRVDARRLRDKLREYDEGPSEPVVISLPKGSYVPVFEAIPFHTTRHGCSSCSRPVRRRCICSYTPRVRHLRRAGLPTSRWRSSPLIVAGPTWRALLSLTMSSTAAALGVDPGVEGPPALSPDGDLVASPGRAGADAGPTDIYVKAVESEALRRLTETPVSKTSPAWSPTDTASPSSGAEWRIHDVATRRRRTPGISVRHSGGVGR